MKINKFKKVKIGVFSVVLFFICSTTTLYSQVFCTNDTSDQVQGELDGYRYELWNQNSEGTACMTLGKGALFSGEWIDIHNYLARRGLSFNETQDHKEIGSFSTTYNCEYNPSSAKKGNSYLSVYGWTTNPLTEFYILEDWRNWIPSMDKNAVLKGSFFADGSMYDVYECIRTNQPSIVGVTTFPQYFSIRRDRRNSGDIDISAHFNQWESLGLIMGRMYEVSFVVEGYQSSGSFNFKQLEIHVK